MHWQVLKLKIPESRAVNDVSRCPAHAQGCQAMPLLMCGTNAKSLHIGGTLSYHCRMMRSLYLSKLFLFSATICIMANALRPYISAGKYTDKTYLPESWRHPCNTLPHSSPSNGMLALALDLNLRH